MNITVLGAAGWLGRAILENLSVHHDVRAVDVGPEAWTTDSFAGEIVHGDITDFDTVDRTIEGADAAIHVAVYAGIYADNDDQPFLINLKGLWNTLESARRRGLRRIVHIGSCQVEHPEEKFFTSETRRPDGSLYAATKRLQEELCRQFHDAFGLPIVVLRPCSIIDGRTDQAKGGAPLEPGSWNVGMVCRHDVAEACRLAVEREVPTFDVLHLAGSPEAEAHCNVKETQRVLGLTFRADLDKYR